LQDGAESETQNRNTDIQVNNRYTDRGRTDDNIEMEFVWIVLRHARYAVEIDLEQTGWAGRIVDGTEVELEGEEYYFEEDQACARATQG
jgi:hypothetical protein